MLKVLISGLIALAFVVSTASANDPPPFKIATKRDNDRVTVNIEKDQTVFSVHSPFGISHAVIEQAVEKWPDLVMLRLHLKGLENFGVTGGKVKLEGAVSSQDSKMRLWKDGKEDALLDAKSPCWIEVRIVGGDGKQAKEIPLKGGYFELQLPKAIFEGNPKSITLNWIDFYRN